MRSESTVAFGHPSETKPTFGCAGMTMAAALAAFMNQMIKNGTERSGRRRAEFVSPVQDAVFLFCLKASGSGGELSGLFSAGPAGFVPNGKLPKIERACFCNC